MKEDKIYHKAKTNPYGLRFNEFCNLIEAFGFIHRRQKGSHVIYGRPDIPEFVNIQSDRGKAKSYQVKQFLQLIEKYDLRMEE
ncbi:MAG: hypothetical protein A3G93_00010 [Nitrospinae bacterium RIFCSPLOWO2_12_FULL_45_22]|nr:MAG: hypothetical protein A3G93_00010 [Nitrospinae bacterium RIFCSPLOWO2_12_FULL_45_22]